MTRWALGFLALSLCTVAPIGVSTALADTPSPSSAGPATAGEPQPGDELPSNGQLSNFTIDDADPAAAVPAVKDQIKNPIQFGYLLMDLSDRADAALREKDFARASRYYKAIVKAAPQRSVGHSKLCQSYMGMNDLVNAREACHEALFHEGVVPIDFVRYLRLLLDTKKTFEPGDVEQANDVFAHLKEQKIEAQEIYQLMCDVALRIGDLQRMGECTQALAAKWPDDPRTITYQWSLAVSKKDFATAEKFVQRARSSTMTPDGVQKMEAATRAEQRKARPKYLLLGAGVLTLVALGAMVLRMLRQMGARSA